LSKEIVVHSLDHARAALDAAAGMKRSLTVASAPGAAMQAGPAWFKAVIDEARAAHPDVALTAILDCGGEPGAVMAGLRAGLKYFRFSGPAAVRAKLVAMGAAFAEPAEMVLDLREARRPEAALRDFLGRD
jgi:hypothetical protein